MASNQQKQRQIGKSAVKEAKPLIDPKYKSFVNTIVFIIILIIFYIVNNTRNEPEHGPYPPFYKKNSEQTTNP